MLEENLNSQIAKPVNWSMEVWCTIVAFLIVGVERMFNVVEEMVLQCDRTALAHSAHLLGYASPLNLGNQRGGTIN